MISFAEESVIFGPALQKCQLSSEAAATPESVGPSDGRWFGQINIPIGDYVGDACGQGGGNVGGGGQPFVCLDSGFGKSEKAGGLKSKIHLA